MKKLEDQLDTVKNNLDNLEIPEDMEARLRSALNSHKQPTFTRSRLIAACLTLVILLTGFNYDAIAYYGKKILGYDEIIQGSLKELNDQGAGQEIGKSYKFADGMELILDGVVYDDKEIVVLYRIKSPKPMDVLPFHINLTGMFGEYISKGGAGKFTDDFMEVASQDRFEAPKVFDKYLKITTWGKDRNQGSISFTLDKSKAMKRVIKQDINKTLEVDGLKYTFTSISASPLSTLLEGYIEGSGATGLIGPSSSAQMNLDMKLTYLQDGKETEEILAGSLSSMGSGSDQPGKVFFKYTLNGLRPGIKQISLNFNKFSRIPMAETTVKIGSSARNLDFEMNSEVFTVTDASYDGNTTTVNILGKKNISFVGLGMFNSDKQLKQLSYTSKAASADGKEMELHTFKFEGGGNDLKIMIKAISYDTPVNKELIIYKE